MKLLRNISIYYILLGGIMLFNLYTAKFGIGIGVLGVFLLVVYFLVHHVLEIEDFPPVSKKKKIGIRIFSYLFPFLFIASILWYLERPYRQVIVLPPGYEGVVVVRYGEKDGQPKKWTGGFLGIGSRLIQVNDSGYAKTRFTYHYTRLPLFYSGESYTQNGLKVYYQNNLSLKIPIERYGATYNFDKKYEETEGEYQKRMNTIYCFTTFLESSPEELWLVIAKPVDYRKYFGKGSYGEDYLLEKYWDKNNNE